jgi:hypothetical protein
MRQAVCGVEMMPAVYAWDALASAAPSIQGYDFGDAVERIADSASLAMARPELEQQVDASEWLGAATNSLGYKSEKQVQAALFRDIIGNPFRSILLDPSWLTPTVLSLAQTAYGNRNLPAGTLDNQRLAVLTDALEDAGATGAILEHLRSEGPHVRGCFALDLLLGKE